MFIFRIQNTRPDKQKRFLMCKLLFFIFYLTKVIGIDFINYWSLKKLLELKSQKGNELQVK